MLRHRSLTLALCLTAVIAVSACGKKKPTATAAPGLRRRPRSLRIRRLRPRRRHLRRPRPCADRGRSVCQEEPRGAECREAAAPCSLPTTAPRERGRPRVHRRTWSGCGSGATARARRGTLRQPRHAGIQSRARRTARLRRDVPPEPRPPRDARDDRQQGRGAAVLQRGAEKPASRRTVAATS